MFQIIESPATRKATSALGTETGLLTIASAGPVLCCPAVAVATLAVKGLAVAAGYEAATPNSNSDGDTAVLTPTAVNGYIAPGQLTPSTAPVTDNASVEELIGATATRRAA